eukprot:scaffold22532_cov93-Cylindrotheca_fusiformis.AAC.2
MFRLLKVEDGCLVKERILSSLGCVPDFAPATYHPRRLRVRRTVTAPAMGERSCDRVYPYSFLLV